MAQDLYYSSTAVLMSLSAGISPTDTSCLLSTTAGLPVSFPFKLLLDWGSSAQEVVHCTALSGSTATIIRAQDNTSGQAHTIGATVVHGVSAYEFNTSADHRAETTNVHGVTGSLVGTSNTQTLTNKTLTQPEIATLSADGTHVLTVPVVTDTLVGRTTTDTLTNKTLTSPTVNGGVLDSASSIGGVTGTQLAADHSQLATAPVAGGVSGGVALGSSAQTITTISLPAAGKWLVSAYLNVGSNDPSSSDQAASFTTTPDAGITVTGKTAGSYSEHITSGTPGSNTELSFVFIATVSTPGNVRITGQRITGADIISASGAGYAAVLVNS